MLAFCVFLLTRELFFRKLFLSRSFYSNCSVITEVGEPDGYVFHIGATTGGIKVRDDHGKTEQKLSAAHRDGHD